MNEFGHDREAACPGRYIAVGPNPFDTAAVGTEHAEQVALFMWAAWQFERFPELRLMFAIPNGGKREKITAANLKAEGVKAHVPDICLPVARAGCHGLFVEMKKIGGRPHPDQSKYIDDLRKQGFGACVCEGWLLAARTIWKYLNS